MQTVCAELVKHPDYTLALAFLAVLLIAGLVLLAIDTMPAPRARRVRARARRRTMRERLARRH